MLDIHVTVLVTCLLCLISSAGGSQSDEVEDRLSRLEQAMVSQMILNSDTEALEERLAEAEQMIGHLQTEVLHLSPGAEGQQSDSIEQTTLTNNFLTESPGNMSHNTGDCQTLHENGHDLDGSYSTRLDGGQLSTVLCEMSNSEQWTIIQQRVAGDTDFYRTYQEYEHGFGTVSATTDFWIGLDSMNQLTSGGNYMLRVDLVDWDNQSRYAEYSEFSVGGDGDGYLLHVAGYNGTAGNSLGTSKHNGQQFSTHDHDRDTYSGGNCAELWHGGWWFGACFRSHLNGEYYRLPDHTPTSDYEGIIWKSWRGYNSLKSTQMKIRRRP